jgi:hypothetical protein
MHQEFGEHRYNKQMKFCFDNIADEIEALYKRKPPHFADEAVS